MNLIPLWADYKSKTDGFMAGRVPVWGRPQGHKSSAPAMVLCEAEFWDKLHLATSSDYEDSWALMDGSLEGLLEDVTTYNVADLGLLKWGVERGRRPRAVGLWKLLTESLRVKKYWQRKNDRNIKSHRWHALASHRSLDQVDR